MNEEWPIGKPLVLSNPYEGMISAIAEKAIDKALADSREIVPAYPDCAHDSISMTVSIEHDRVFWCPTCQKKIEIPFYTEAVMSQSDMAGIVGMAFGERWKQYLEEMEKEQ